MTYLVLTNKDDANNGYDLFMSLRANGCDVVGIKQTPHRYNYPDQLPVERNNQIILEILKRSDVVIFPQVDLALMNLCVPHLINKKVIVMHGGSEYRRNKTFWNNYCNPFASATILSPDNWNEGAKNPFLWFTIDTEKLRPSGWYKGGPVKIYHSASNPELKRTYEIERVLNEVSQTHSFEFKSNRNELTWEQNIEQMRWCDIYIDHMNSNLSMGTAAREAAALGKVVITYGVDLNPPLMSCTLDELPAILRDYTSSFSAMLIPPHQQHTRRWVEKHSYRNAGKMLIEKINSV